MTDSLHMSAELRQECSGPEIKGSVGYITPTDILWSVDTYGARTQPGPPKVYVRATIGGWGRNGKRAIGHAYFGHNDNLPNWVERPTEWITLVSKLMAAAYEIEAAA